MQFTIKKWPYFAPFLLVGFILIASLTYAFSSSIFQLIAPYDQKRALQLVMLLIIPIVTILVPSYRQMVMLKLQTMSWQYQLALLLFFGLGALSSSHAKIPHDAFLQWSLYILLLFFCLFWFAVSKPLKNHYYIATVIMLFISITVYIIIDYRFILHMHLTHTPSLLDNNFLNFGNIRFFSQVAIWITPLLPLAYFICKRYVRFQLWRYLCIIISGCWWSLVLDNFSRGFLFSLFLSSVLLFCLVKKQLLPWIAQTCLYILLGYLFLKLLQLRPNFYHILGGAYYMHHAHSISQYFLNRTGLFKTAFLASIHHPWLGLGPMHFAYGPWHSMNSYYRLHAHPHNSILQIMSEWGIPATICLLYMLFSLLIHFIRMIHTQHKAIDPSPETITVTSAFAISLFSGLMYSLCSGVIVMPLSQTLMAIIAGACLALYQDYQPQTQQKAPPEWRYRLCRSLTLICIVCAFSVTLVSLLITFPTLKMSKIRWLMETHATIPPAPNYWSVGWLTNQVQYADPAMQPSEPAASLNNVLIHTY